MSFADFLDRLESSLVVRHIATSRPDLRTATPDSTPEEVQAMMEDEDFDVLPVDDARSIHRYFERQDCGPPVLKTITVTDIVSTELSLLDLIDHFAASGRRFYLTLGGRQIDGIVTCADLNKSAVRVLIYAVLNRLELLLSAVVQAHHDGTEWLNLLTADKRKKIQQRLDEARLGNVELQATAYLDLSDLVEICKKTPKTWHTLGIESKEKLGSRYGPLVDLRNDVAHPVRSLITASKDVTRLRKRIGTAQEALATLEQEVRLTQ